MFLSGCRRVEGDVVLGVLVSRSNIADHVLLDVPTAD